MSFKTVPGRPVRAHHQTEEIMLDKRLAKSVSRKVVCEDSKGRPCCLRWSVRRMNVAVFIEGGNEWAQMSSRQAKSVAVYLLNAADEVDARVEGK